MKHSSSRIFIAFFVLIFLSCACGGQPRARPQVSTQRTGEHYPPVPKGVKVKVYFRGEPEESYREIGFITSTCPEKHWVGGNQKKGRPVCVDGLRQGARKIGAQAIVEIKTKRFHPSWEPESPWLIMKGVAVRLSH